MKMLIDIQEETYNKMRSGEMLYPADANVAIFAIKTGTPLEEQEPCDDAISRQAVIDLFKKWQPYMATRIHEFEKELYALPPVTPAEKVGHWISIGDFECRCSECHLWCYKRNRSQYCPSCGAKMQEGE